MNTDDLLEAMNEGAAIRIAELEREIKTLAKKLERARSAIAVIHTWATFEYKDKPRGHALVPSQVADVCDRVLKETE